MQAIFITHGPFSNAVKSARQRRDSSFLRKVIRFLLGRWCNRIGKDNAYIIDTFKNVELYNLVTKLLDIEAYAGPTNGTMGFWDKYL